MHSQILFVDIETVPDTEILPVDFAADAFPPKPIQHRVVAISFLAASLVRDGRSEGYAVEECRSGGDPGASEEQLLRGFWKKFERDKPRIVTWNGRGFDVPVLVQRAFVYGIPANYWHQAGDKWSGYRHRYAVESHCDLMDALADHGASNAQKLEEAAIALGLPGKIGGHGSEVRDMVAAGNIAGVRAYCESDVLKLFVFYMSAGHLLLGGPMRWLTIRLSRVWFLILRASESRVRILANSSTNGVAPTGPLQ
jgi:predicted PolB exonuclease-like 3'-5' exonuclease